MNPTKGYFEKYRRKDNNGGNYNNHNNNNHNHNNNKNKHNFKYIPDVYLELLDYCFFYEEGLFTKLYIM